MTDYTEKEMLELYRRCQKGDVDARNELFMIHLPLVRAMVKRYASFRMEEDDIFQEGSMGLISALEKYDPDRGTRFSTYAVPFILGAIRNYLRQRGHLIKHSRFRLQLCRQLLRNMELLEQVYARKPSTEELARETGISREEAAWLLESALPALPLGSQTSQSLKEEEQPDAPEEKALQKIILQEKLNSLPPLERQVIVLRYYMEKSQQETGHMLGISQSRVSRLEKEVMEQWRKDEEE